MRPSSTRAKLLQIEDWPRRAAEANYGSKVFLAQVAQECGTSTKSVQRFFQEHFNKSVQQQLDEFRTRRVPHLQS
jgi:AraC-like DNA-binding protein